jgi:hypothetical protein
MAKTTKKVEKETLIKTFNLKFIPTGNVFNLPEKEAIEILKTDRGNYQIIDKDFIDDIENENEKEKEKEKEKETSTYEQVVEE